MIPLFALMLVDSRIVRTSTLLRKKLENEGLSKKKE